MEETKSEIISRTSNNSSEFSLDRDFELVT